MPFAAVGSAIAAAAPAIAGGVAASAAGSLISGALQSGSVDGSAATANGISQKAIDDANANRLTDRSTFQPFVDQGTAGLNQLTSLLGVNGPDAAKTAMTGFTASPGYSYAYDQGLRAVDAGAAAKGMRRSGATLKAEQTLGNNLASQDFGNYINRLTNLTGVGLQGATGQAGTTSAYNSLLGGQTTNQVNTTTGAGGADASIYGNTASGLTSAVKSTNWNSLFGGAGTNSNFGGAGSTTLAFS